MTARVGKILIYFNLVPRLSQITYFDCTSTYDYNNALTLGQVGQPGPLCTIFISFRYIYILIYNSLDIEAGHVNPKPTLWENGTVCPRPSAIDVTFGVLRFTCIQTNYFILWFMLKLNMLRGEADRRWLANTVSLFMYYSLSLRTRRYDRTCIMLRAGKISIYFNLVPRLSQITFSTATSP